MKVIVIGGGKVGYYTTKTLSEQGLDVKVIEQDRVNCDRIASELDVPVICADGTTVEALAQAGAGRADAVIAVTGTDEDNIVACQIAKRRFAVQKVISRANNPKNVDIIKRLGADIAVSSTQIITNLIEMEVDTSGLKLLATLNRGEAGIIELVVPDDWKHIGQSLAQLTLPRGCIIVAVARDSGMEIPRGDTVLRPRDHVTAVVDKSSRRAFQRIFY
ncbi:MAG: TrkA family potassium uptake protein [Clostridiales bacterium]|nr:TrkA family potassium uptake protein [Clostridiales bacterium]